MSIDKDLIAAFESHYGEGMWGQSFSDMVHTAFILGANAMKERCAQVCNEAADRSHAAYAKTKRVRELEIYAAAESRALWLATTIRDINTEE